MVLVHSAPGHLLVRDSVIVEYNTFVIMVFSVLTCENLLTSYLCF